MKKISTTAAVLGASLVLGTAQSWAISAETTMLLELLKTKGVISQNEADNLISSLTETMTAASTEKNEHHHSVQSSADRVATRATNEEAQWRLGDKIRLSGLIETEMTTSRTHEEDGTQSNSSDLTLATAQLNADTEINRYVGGRLALLYEEGAIGDDIVIDEAIISLKNGDNSPLYANIGRQYVPFGRFESHFISDPGPLILGETRDTAVVVGFANEIGEFTLGGFKGEIKETDGSDHINTAMASATLTMPRSNEGGLSLSGGVSYLSNLATSDSLESETTIAGEITDTVGGWSSFVSVGYDDRFFFDAEYLGAVKDFAANDFSFTNEENLRPGAWNLEAAARLSKNAELAFRYGGSNDTGSFLAEDEYGAALLYNIFDSTNLTFEYLYQKFMNTGDKRQGAIQLAVEF